MLMVLIVCICYYKLKLGLWNFPQWHFAGHVSYMFISLTSSAHINMFKSCKSFIMVHVQPTTWDLHLELLFRSNSGRRLTCAHKIDSVAHTGFCLTCTHKSVSVVHTEPSGDGVGLVNVIIFLAVQQTQALLVHDQLPVGWGGLG